jgi:acetyl-CoA carboxylase carboxyl transferase subunit beta
MAWFKKTRKPIEASPDKVSRVPEGLWVKCPSCGHVIYSKEFQASLQVCPKCAHHFRLTASDRLKMLFDGETWTEIDAGLRSTDPLEFTGTKKYKSQLATAIATTGLNDAIIGGSMGVVVGERITRAIERGLADRCPVIVVSCSGGARMMEGALSLMQMAKISAALARLDRAGLPYISVMTDPTTGGVTASYAMLGDLNIAEPKALIGFAGPRVIEQAIRQKLPEGFQRSEFLLEKGFIDAVVDRRAMKPMLAQTLRQLMGAPAAG